MTQPSLESFITNPTPQASGGSPATPTPSVTQPTVSPATVTPGSKPSLESFINQTGQADSVANQPNTTTSPEATGNAFTGFMNGMLDATTLPRWGAQAQKLELQTKDLFGGQLTDTEREELATNMFNEKGVGGEDRKIAAFGSDADNQGKPMGFKSVLDSAGVGLSASSFLVPVGGEAKGAFALAKSAGWFGKLLKDTAPFAVTQALGQGAQDLGQGKGAPQALTDTAVNYITAVGGFGLLRGAGALIKATAGSLMKSDIVKSANQALIDFVGKTLSLDGRFAQGGAISAKDANLQTQYLTKQYNAVHNDAIDAIANTIKTPTDSTAIYKTVVDKVNNVFDNLFQAKDAKYGQVFSKDMIPNTKPEVGAYSQIFDAIDRTGAQLAEGAPVTSKTGEMFFNGKANSPAMDYLYSIQDALGPRSNPSPVSMFKLNQLYTSAPVSSNSVENKAIKDMMTSLYRGAKDELAGSTDPRASETMKAWNEAHDQWSNLREMMATKFRDTMRNVSDVGSAVENFMNSEPDVPTVNAINQLDPATKESMSEVMFNKALDLTRQPPFASDYNAGGKALTKMLDNWSGTGLISPQHESILRSYADAMQGTYDDMANYLKNLTENPTMEAGTLEKQTAAQGAEGKLSSAQGAQARLDTGSAIEKQLGGKPLFKMNEDGSYDFTNLSKVIDKVNTNGQYDELVKQLEMVDKLGEHSSKTLVGVTKAAIGASLFHAHPFVSLGILRSSASDIFGKTADKVTSTDMAKFISKQMGAGKFSEQQYNQFLTSVLMGDFKTAGDVFGKAFIGTTNQGKQSITNTIFPQPEMPDWFSQNFQNQTGEVATPDHYQQFLQSQSK